MAIVAIPSGNSNSSLTSEYLLSMLLKPAPPVCINVRRNPNNACKAFAVNRQESREVVVSNRVTASRSPQNAHSWDASAIADAVGGEIVKWGPPGTICTDSRKLIPGEWFLAISGENFDGHDFVDHALADKGCVGVIGNRVCENWAEGFIKVEGSTVLALEKMALYARSRFHGVIVCLTGSVGKTTTRTMVALALENLGRVYQTHGNFNNKLGVAMTLVGMPLDANAAIVELGMGGLKGEIFEVAQMCQPSVRVVLNVRHCHMNYFNSLEEVSSAKGELLMEAKPGDICVLNADDPLVMSIPVPSGVKKVFFGKHIGCDVRLVLAESVDGGCAVRVVLESEMHRHCQPLSTVVRAGSQMVEFKIEGPGLHFAMNACAAAATAMSLGVPLHQIADSLSRFRPVCMRSEMELTNSGIKIINDAYNASLASMLAAIETLQSIDCSGKKVAILGDMLELGSMEEEAHEMVLKLCCDVHLGLLMLAGKRFLVAAEKFKLLDKVDFIWAVDSESLALNISEMLAPKDVVLVKGSRAMHMEKVVDVIKTTDV